MDKTCFIIMPISDSDTYPVGHFKRVYDYLIKPACEIAGFKPVRADDVLNTNYIALDIIKNIIQADMALCDLSGRNPNVMYELGIRQAFNKPVTLIKDTVTNRIFDISGFRDIEYDETLRIDAVQTNVEVISATLKNTFQTSGQEINSLISLLGIEPAKIERTVQISTDTELIINAINGLELKFSDLQTRYINQVHNSNVAEATSVTFTPMTVEEVSQLKAGDTIVHQKFGRGLVKKIEGSARNPIATIDFDNGASNKIMLNYATIALIK